MRAALALCLALAACQSAPPPAPVPVSPQCADAADRDPAYEQALAISAGNTEWQWQHEPDIQRMKAAAIARCMNGASGFRGGVERPR